MQETPTLRRILRRPEAALYVGLKAGTLANYAARGLGPATVRLGTRAVGYTIEALDAWVRERVEATAEQFPATG